MAERDTKGRWVDGSAGHFKHGLTRTPFHNKYHLLKSRCENPGNNRYERYGARGIKCEWESFDAFKDDMYESYLAHVAEHGEKNTQIDRVNSNGNYNKENCRWVTIVQQANNKRNVKLYTIGEETHSLPEWCRIKNVTVSRVRTRVGRLSWELSVALNTPKNGKYGNS